MTTRNSPARTSTSMSASAATSRSVPSFHALLRPTQASVPSTGRSSDLGGPAPPQHAALDLAERRVEKITDESDHRHTEEGQVHIHHLPADHDNGAEAGVDADHLSGEHAHPR